METSLHVTVMFYEKCRLCLGNPGIKHIFTKKDTNEDHKNACLDLPHAIYSCTGIKVSPKDNLPSKICQQCLEIVVKATELKLLAQKNNSHLRSLFSDDENDELEDKKSSCTENIEEEEVESAYKYYQYDEPPEKHKNINESPINLRESSEKNKSISIRKDLFTTGVSSSTNVSAKDHDSKESPRKRMKIDDGTEYLCGDCSKSFETWKKLYLHQRTHNKSILCPLDACGKKFATKGDLEKHVRTHTGVKPFVCDICDKGFTQQGTLKTHKESVHYSFTYV